MCAQNLSCFNQCLQGVDVKCIAQIYFHMEKGNLISNCTNHCFNNEMTALYNHNPSQDEGRKLQSIDEDENGDDKKENMVLLLSSFYSTSESEQSDEQKNVGSEDEKSELQEEIIQDVSENDGGDENNQLLDEINQVISENDEVIQNIPENESEDENNELLDELNQMISENEEVIQNLSENDQPEDNEEVNEIISEDEQDETIQIENDESSEIKKPKITPIPNPNQIMMNCEMKCTKDLQNFEYIEETDLCEIECLFEKKTCIFKCNNNDCECDEESLKTSEQTCKSLCSEKSSFSSKPKAPI